MTVHRGDLNRALRGLTVAMLELEAAPEAKGVVPAVRRLWLEIRDLREIELTGAPGRPESWDEMGVPRGGGRCLFCVVDAA